MSVIPPGRRPTLPIMTVRALSVFGDRPSSSRSTLCPRPTIFFAPSLLELRVGVLHDDRIETEARDHEERFFLRTTRILEALAVLQVAEVRSEGLTREGDLDGAAEVIDRDVEVSREKIPSAHRDNPERDVAVRKPRRDETHRAIASGRKDNRAAVGHRLLSLTEARILHGRFVERHLRIRVHAEDVAHDPTAKFGDILEF